MIAIAVDDEALMLGALTVFLLTVKEKKWALWYTKIY